MEQHRSQNQIQQARTPLMCPRCGSMNTKFRYYNNHSLSQPRHYCRNCKRLWTVGGNIRPIPVGGNTRTRHTNAIGSTSGSSRSQHQPLQLPSGVPMPTTFPQPLATDMNLLHDWNFQSLASGQSFPQQIHDYNGQSNNVDPRQVELDRFHYQGQGSYQLPTNLVQPTNPMEFAPQSNSGFNFSTSDASLQNNFSGSTSNNDLPPAFMDPTQWPQFPDYSTP